MENLSRSTSGSGPDALPPNVLSRSPETRSLLVSQRAIFPDQSNERNSRNPLAQPSLESLKTMVVSVSCSSSGTSGNLLTYLLSTEKPTPTPHMERYMISSNALGLSMGR